MYQIVLTKQAIKALRKMPRNVSDLIHEKLIQIAAEPFASHPNATRLQNRSGYRLRVGDWRVIYELNDDKLIVLVLKIASRGEVYR